MNTFPTDPQDSTVELSEKSTEEVAAERRASGRRLARSRLVRQSAVVAGCGVACPFLGASWWYAIGLIVVAGLGFGMSRLIRIAELSDEVESAS